MRVLFTAMATAIVFLFASKALAQVIGIDDVFSSRNDGSADLFTSEEGN